MSPPRCQCHMDVVLEQPMQGPGHIRAIELQSFLSMVFYLMPSISKS